MRFHFLGEKTIEVVKAIIFNDGKPETNDFKSDIEGKIDKDKEIVLSLPRHEGKQTKSPFLIIRYKF